MTDFHKHKYSLRKAQIHTVKKDTPNLLNKNEATDCKQYY